jgi:hypothetical protein
MQIVDSSSGVQPLGSHAFLCSLQQPSAYFSLYIPVHKPQLVHSSGYVYMYTPRRPHSSARSWRGAAFSHLLDSFLSYQSPPPSLRSIRVLRARSSSNLALRRSLRNISRRRQLSLWPHVRADRIRDSRFYVCGEANCLEGVFGLLA